MPANLCITPDLGKEDMDPDVEFAYYNQMDLLWGYD